MPALASNRAPVRDGSASAAGLSGFAGVLGVAAVALLLAQHWLAPAISPSTGQVTAAGGATVALAAPLAFVAAGAWRWPARPVLLRLVRPLAPFAVVALPLVDGAARLLWLPAALALFTAMTPTLVRLHHRWRGAEVAATAAGAVGLDVVRFGALGGSDAVGALSVLTGWLVAYQVGVVVAAGGLDRLRTRLALAVSAAGFAVAAFALVLDALATPGAASHAVPPAAVLLAGTAGQAGLALAARPMIDRWTACAPVAHGLAWLSPRLLTIHLWHLPAVAVVAAVSVRMFGYEPPAPFGERWRADLPWWLLCAGAVLAVLVHLLGRLGRLERLAVGTALVRTHRLTGSSTLQGHERLEA